MAGWQFNVLFLVGVGGAVLLLIGPAIGLEFAKNPLAVSGVGAILSYVLTQRKNIVKKEQPKTDREPQHRKEEDSDGDD